MSARKECVGMILAGGQGSRLGVLTRWRAKPAVPFGGKYRIIDFPLSNCTNSGIDVVGVLTQYEPFVLNSYIGNGAPWDLDTNTGGAYVLSPYTHMGDEGNWYLGTADAIFQNIRFIDRFDPKYVVILSGDHIYKMDYSDMVAFHKRSGATATIAVMPVPIEEASRFGILATDENARITDFVEKPKDPPSNLASMGIYVFSWDVVRQYLIDDEANPDSSRDFGKDVIPAMLAADEPMYAYRFEGYWRDVGTIDSLWEANMDMLDGDSGLDMNDDSWKIYSRNPNLPAARIAAGSSLDECMVAEGCDISGEVRHSVLFQGVTVGEGARVVDSVVMRGAVIEAGAVVERAVVAEDAHVGAGAKVGEPDAALCVLGSGCKVPAGSVVAPGESVEPDASVEVD
ncbi:MAG: glucose-1-phosphate adenylyltransferase [Coriobacteriaceae bacterium]|nr:glucose-1-phosphate adenylyltransferase [Coriobacteriaceae bacterium]